MSCERASFLCETHNILRLNETYSLCRELVKRYMFLPFISDYKGYIAHEGRTKKEKQKNRKRVQSTPMIRRKYEVGEARQNCSISSCILLEKEISLYLRGLIILSYLLEACEYPRMYLCVGVCNL